MEDGEEIVIEVHTMSLQLPRIEIYEEGSQIRRSSKSCKSTIVEGFGRRRYKNEYLKFLHYSIASNDETRDHLENLYETKSLTDEILFNSILKKINLLGKKLYYFSEGVEREHKSIK